MTWSSRSHSKKTPQDGFNVGRHFKEQQFDNLLNSQGYTANLVSLFQKEPGLGMVFPPMIHIGYPTLGRGWSVNKEGAADIAEQLGIFVPLDDISRSLRSDRCTSLVPRRCGF